MNAKQLTTELEIQAHTIESMRMVIESLQEQIDILSAQSSNPAPRTKGQRDYGPSSQRKMTERDAYNIRYGYLSLDTVNEICKAEGLSRGQVYSVRGGYTFRNVDESWSEE